MQRHDRGSHRRGFCAHGVAPVQHRARRTGAGFRRCWTATGRAAALPRQCRMMRSGPSGCRREDSTTLPARAGSVVPRCSVA